MLRRIAIAALLVLASAGAPAGAADRLNASVLAQPKAVPEFSLTDQDGRPFTLQQLKGHWSLLAVGYTSCPDVCPFTMSDLDAVTRLLNARLPEVVFVAIDPARDRPVLKAWVQQFNPGFHGVTGPGAELARLVKGIGGFYHLGKPDKDGFYAVAHSGGVSVVDPQGRLRARVLLPMPPKKTAAFLADLMRAPAGS